MGIFWWIPAVIPLIGMLIILFSPLWPVFAWEGVKSQFEADQNWKKFGIYALANIIGCLVIAVLMWQGGISKQKFNEVWNFKGVKMTHEMKWTTEESREEDDSYTDSDGKTHHRTKTVYYTEEHGPYWKLFDEYGEEYSISQTEYNNWKNVWKNESQTGIHKGSSAGFDRSIDGPIFTMYWPKTFETTYPMATIHSYVNKIRVSQSVFNLGKPTKELQLTYPRPADLGDTSPVIYCGGNTISDSDRMLLCRVNATLGRSKEVHTILVLMGKHERGTVSDILKAWQGPNKNELVTFLSLDGNKVRWVEVHSWIDNTTLHATLRDELMSSPFTIQRYADLLMKHVPKLWFRKHFTPINDYLHVSVHPGWVISGTILAILLGIITYLIIERNIPTENPYVGYSFGGNNYRFRVR